MKKLLYIIAIGMVLFVGLTLTGCSSNSNTETEQNYQNSVMEQANAEIGMPEVTEFYEKKLAKEIIELRDDSKLICYVYNYIPMTGLYSYVGKSMGYGLPYSTQYTNPEAFVYYHGGYDILPQADPNGLYSSSGVAATWIMMINETTGTPYVMYAEPDMVIVQDKLPLRLVSNPPADY